MSTKVWRKKATAMVIATLASVGVMGTGSQAASIDGATAASYDKMVNIAGNLDSFDVTVKETTTIPGQTESALKTVYMKAAGLQSENNMKVSMKVVTDDGEKNQYYSNGYFYTDQSGDKIKYRMDQSEILELMNYDVYLNFDSGRLDTLSLSEKTDRKVYSLSATRETLGDYTDKILEGALQEHQVEIITVQGTVEATTDNKIQERSLQTVYTIQNEGKKQACIMSSEAVFKNPGEKVTVTLPDLSAYKEQGKNEATVEITQKNQTVYATDDVNVRAQNSITAAIIGGASAGTALKELGYTSDGWIQISYNGSVGYVSSDYISTEKPVIVADMSGTMYATTSVYIRSLAGTDGAILGSFAEGDSVTVTGYTDNNWIRVRYKGTTAYVFADYLTWKEPEKVVSGYLSGTISGITWSTITVTTAQGENVSLDTSKAYLNVVDGLVAGDRVDISYEQKGDKMTAIQINDYTYHTKEEDSRVNEMVYGVVMAQGMSTITISCDDGTSMTFFKANAQVRGQVYVGAYVSAAYYYDASVGGYHLTYMSVI